MTQTAQTPQQPNLRFLGNVVVNFYIVCRTGLHIGGTSEGCEIGGMDNPVIKDPLTHHPYIPGSSLKGKSRSLLEWRKGLQYKQNPRTHQWGAGPCACGTCDICKVYGTAADKVISPVGPTRLIFQDFFPTEDTVKRWQTALGEVYTEIKSENTIDRLTSEANPRTMERVPADSEFYGSCIYRVLCPEDGKNLAIFFQGLQMVADHFLGGGGSRGNGVVGFEGFSIRWRGRSYYEGQSEVEYQPSDQKTLDTVETVLQTFAEIKTWLEQQANAIPSNRSEEVHSQEAETDVAEENRP